MQLFYAAASPFVRKVLVLAHETGLVDQLRIETVTVSPVNPDDRLNAGNPVGKIPALLLDDGNALYDSPVVCEYLDSLEHAGPKMFPAGSERWQALRRQALADGIMDAAVLCRYEAALRPEEFRWDDWSANQQAKISRALDALETEIDSFSETVDIGAISVGCALGYLDFRFADNDWRSGRPKLAAWYETFAQRPSMQQTQPPAG